MHDPFSWYGCPLLLICSFGVGFWGGWVCARINAPKKAGFSWLLVFNLGIEPHKRWVFGGAFPRITPGTATKKQRLGGWAAFPDSRHLLEGLLHFFVYPCLKEIDSAIKLRAKSCTTLKPGFNHTGKSSDTRVSERWREMNFETKHVSIFHPD